MKPNIFIRLTLLCSLVAACATAPRRDFTPNQKVQTLAVTTHAHIYAQDDVILRDDSLDAKLSTMNQQWSHDLAKASTYKSISVAAFIAQVLALGVCIGQTNVANVLGWCAGSVAMGGITIPLSIWSDDIKYSVVNQYNQGIGTH